ncbi:MAG: DUF4214 domain-containing protein [Clostridia bacterium]|nr:DUF4214 domain-containing protein [Clostridia bacterium]
MYIGKKAISAFLSFIIVFSFSPAVLASTTNPDPGDNLVLFEMRAYPSGVEGFIARLYDLVMGRQYDQEGLNYWVSQLDEGNMNASNIARYFFSCEEYYGIGYTLDEYLNVLYKVFFDRKPDTDGYNYWKSLVLDQGKTRRDVLEGFINSKEWANICLKYGVVSGTSVAPSDTKARSQGVVIFVSNLYSVVLGREADQAGLDFWCDNLTYMRDTAKTCAKGFYDSPEFSKLYSGMNDEARVKAFYKVFLGRDPEGEGLQFWMNEIKGKSTKDGINILYNGFADSKEFKDICKSNGIVVNMPSSAPAYKADPKVTISVSTSSGTQSITGYYDRELAIAIMDKTNAYRSSLGVGQVKVNAEIIKATDIRCAETVVSFAHTRPNGSSFSTANPNYKTYSENLAAGTGKLDADTVVNLWKNSTNHNKNMINSQWTNIGVSVFIPDSGSYGTYIVEQFS